MCQLCRIDTAAYHAADCPHGVHGKENCHTCTPRDPEPKMRWDLVQVPDFLAAKKRK
jgi:hypothetical protein